MSSADTLFDTIPLSLQRQIDAAFTQAFNHHFNFTRTGSPQAHTIQHAGFSIDNAPIASTSTSTGSSSSGGGGGFLPASPPAGGGFLPPSPPPGGGFLSDDDGNPGVHADPSPTIASTAEPTHLPLRLVPHALQLLDLPPDDSEVLGVFANAAGGWQGLHVHRTSPLRGDGADPSAADEQWLARADWRAVCAVLLEDAGDAQGGGSSPGRSSPGRGDADADADASDVSMSALSDLSDGDDGSSDEYRLSPTRPTSKPKRKARTSGSTPPPSRRTRRGGPAAGGAGSSTSSSAPTPRQRETALAAFALFFPGLEPAGSGAEELKTKRIRVAEIQRAAGLLREKIKAEEMVDMLTLFSTAPDGSMGLDDFMDMMIAAQLA